MSAEWFCNDGHEERTEIAPTNAVKKLPAQASLKWGTERGLTRTIEIRTFMHTGLKSRASIIRLLASSDPWYEDASSL